MAYSLNLYAYINENKCALTTFAHLYMQKKNPKKNIWGDKSYISGQTLPEQPEE